MALRDLLAQFRIDVIGREQLLETDSALRKTVSEAQKLGTALKRLGAYLAVGAVVVGIKSFIESQIQQADALKHNAEKLGITTDELQKYQYAAGEMGVSVNETAIAMRFFNRAVGEAQLGTKAAVKTFGTLGLSLKDGNGQWKSTSDLLGEASDKLKTLPTQAQRTAYAMRLLGRNGSSLLPVLQKGSKKLKEIFQDVDELGGGFNEKFIQQAHDINVQLKKLQMAWRSIYVAIAAEILPIFKKWTISAIKKAKVLIDLAKHTYGFRTALMALAGGAVIFALKRLLGLFNPFKASVKDIMMALLANAPLVAFVALLTAAYLVLDDLYTFMQGGDSIIGRFLDQIGGSGAAKAFRDNLVEAFEKVSAAFAPVKDGMKEFAKSFFQAFVNSIPQIVQWGAAIGTFVVSAIDTAVTGVKQLLQALNLLYQAFRKDGDVNKVLAEMDATNAGWEKRIKAYTDMNDIVQKALTPKPGNTQGNLATKPYAGLPPPPAPSASSLAAQPYAGLPPPPAVNVTVTNNITGAGDPHATANAVGKATKSAVKSAVAGRRDTYAATNAGMPASGQ